MEWGWASNKNSSNEIRLLTPAPLCVQQCPTMRKRCSPDSFQDLRERRRRTVNEGGGMRESVREGECERGRVREGERERVSEREENTHKR